MPAGTAPVKALDVGHISSDGLAPREIVDERVVLERAHAVTDALRAQDVERLAHALRAGSFAGVRDDVQPFDPRDVERLGKQPGRILRLVAAEADAHDAEVAQLGGVIGAGNRVLGAEVARQVGNKCYAKAVIAPRFVEDAAHAGDDAAHVDIAVEVRPDRRRDEYLGVEHVVRDGVGGVVARHVGKIFRRAQRLAHVGEQ